MGRLSWKQRLFAVALGALIAGAQAASPSLLARARSAGRTRSADAAQAPAGGSRS